MELLVVSVVESDTEGFFGLFHRNLCHPVVLELLRRREIEEEGVVGRSDGEPIKT